MFMDVKMPKMDGVQLLERVKTVDPQVEVVMITAYASLDTVQRAMRFGAMDYLVKPFAPKELRDAAERALARRKKGNGTPAGALAPLIGQPRGSPPSWGGRSARRSARRARRPPPSSGSSPPSSSTATFPERWPTPSRKPGGRRSPGCARPSGSDRARRAPSRGRTGRRSRHWASAEWSSSPSATRASRASPPISCST
ncbi:MAG: hypothetical protein DMD79_22695 [Candidatus Rokuibacteriota bacterium]|nr:MAG: hypothetical protein DMD79_22695 [Candidatus Rokubacteria bacterium]